MLYLKCSLKDTKLSFLVDTGSAVCVVPPKFVSTTAPTCKVLTAANGSRIKTYGTAKVNVAIKGLRRMFQWSFFVADVTTPLLGADLLSHFDLLVDLKRKRLVDNTTKLNVDCEPCNDSDVRRLASSTSY